MDDSKVFMFPDSKSGIDSNLLLALQNNGGFGNNGYWIWILFMWMFWQNGYGNNGLGGNNGTGFLANQMNNDVGRDLLLQAINGRADALGQIAGLLNGSVDQVKNTLGQLQLGISDAIGKIGMSGLETINAVQLGNAALSRQICESCCENRLAIANQTAEIEKEMLKNSSDLKLQISQMQGDDRLAICQQTNQLGSQADKNTNSILGAIASQNTLITKEFCDLKERELQNKIDMQGDIITQLRGQISNDAQSKMFAEAISALNEKITLLSAKQPNTVPVQYPNIVAANATPYVGNYYPQNNFWG